MALSGNSINSNSLDILSSDIPFQDNCVFQKKNLLHPKSVLLQFALLLFISVDRTKGIFTWHEVDFYFLSRRTD